MQTRFLEEPLSIIALNRYIPVSAISVVSKACYLVIKFILLPNRRLFIQYTVLTNKIIQLFTEGVCVFVSKNGRSISYITSQALN